MTNRWTPSYGEACYFTQRKTRRKYNFRVIGHFAFVSIFITAFFFANLFASQEFRRDPILRKIQRQHDAYQVIGEISYSQQYHPTVTIIVDDVGQDFTLLKSLQNISFPLTVSIIPETRFCTQSADWAFQHGIEVMVHLPMEPLAYPQEDPGPDALMCRMNPSQLRDTADHLLNSVPHAIGTNNHMGSRFTENWSKMNSVLDVISNKGFYFIDSRTTAASIGYELARHKHIPAAQRTLFLDDEHDTESVEQRFLQLIMDARSEGAAVGICHLKPHTIEVLARQNIQNYRDIRFTFASETVSR